ncbi:hypothetical protein [Euzebya sp.]
MDKLWTFFGDLIYDLTYNADITRREAVMGAIRVWNRGATR